MTAKRSDTNSASERLRPPGPIAQKVIASIEKLKRNKVIDLAAWRKGQEDARRVWEGATPSARAAAEMPAFAVYSHVMNWAIGLVEAVQTLPELARFIDRIEKAEEEYEPDYPPMSPITRTFFWHWTLFDITVGVKRETLGSILLDIGRALRMDPMFLGVLERLVESRLGLHVHAGLLDGHIILRELVTDETRSCISSSGYGGRAGELWLARVLPPPVPMFTESVVINTPYVVVRPAAAAWADYFDRTTKRTNASDSRTGYQTLMKRGLDKRYWAEYIFEGYAGHESQVIFVEGLPDVPESRPHSQVNSRL